VLPAAASGCSPALINAVPYPMTLPMWQALRVFSTSRAAREIVAWPPAPSKIAGCRPRLWRQLPDLEKEPYCRP
jgi:hypothetical protein